MHLAKDKNSVQTYIDTLIKITKENKYRNWYISIVNTALNRANCRNEANKKVYYTESHHILPKSFKLGGATDENNLVYLTPKEHYLVHRMLPKFTLLDVHTIKMLYASTCLFKTAIHPDRVEKTKIRREYCIRAIGLRSKIIKFKCNKQIKEDVIDYREILNAKVICDNEVNILLELVDDLKKELPLKYIYRLKRYFMINQYKEINEEIILKYIKRNTLMITKIEREFKIGAREIVHKAKCEIIKKQKSEIIPKRKRKIKVHIIKKAELEVIRKTEIQIKLSTDKKLKNLIDEIILPIKNNVSIDTVIESINLISKYQIELESYNISCRDLNHTRQIRGFSNFISQFGFKLEKIKQIKTTGRVIYKIVT